MEDTRISFETAKIAVSKSFPQDIAYSPWYNELGRYLGRSDLNKNGQTFSDAYPNEPSFYGSAIKPEHKEEFNLETYIAPTQSLLQKWLRETHNIICNVEPRSRMGKPLKYKFGWVIYFDNENKKPIVANKGENTYEGALELGLLTALALIKT